MKVIANARNTNTADGDKTLFDRAWNVIHKNIPEHLKFLVGNLMSLKKSMKDVRADHTAACLDGTSIEGN